MTNFKNNSDVELVEKLCLTSEQIKKEISKVIVGQDETIENLIISLLAKGHCLLVGVPGLAKTLIIKTLSEVLDLSFNRIQFTPDLMPGDIIGTEILEESLSTKEKSFRFIKGPVFANIILADEINRTPPKTQAALLEAMQEGRVTAAGHTFELPKPFFVLATQNPIEQEGTYPLPEAQLDRFMFNLWLDYPSFEEEKLIIKNTTSDYAPELKGIIKAEELIQFQQLIKSVPIADNVIEYAVKVVRNTRTKNNDSIKELVSWGAGPRASQYIVLAAKVRAVLKGKYTPDIDDVKETLLPVLRHRIIPSFSAEADGMTSVDIINKIVSQTK